MKNTLTIAITKYYELKVEATASDLAWDEYVNTSNKRLKLIETDIQYHEFKVNNKRKKDSYDTRRNSKGLSQRE